MPETIAVHNTSDTQSEPVTIKRGELVENLRALEAEDQPFDQWWDEFAQATARRARFALARNAAGEHWPGWCSRETVAVALVLDDAEAIAPRAATAARPPCGSSPTATSTRPPTWPPTSRRSAPPSPDSPPRPQPPQPGQALQFGRAVRLPRPNHRQELPRDPERLRKPTGRRHRPTYRHGLPRPQRGAHLNEHQSPECRVIRR